MLDMLCLRYGVASREEAGSEAVFLQRSSTMASSYFLLFLLPSSLPQDVFFNTIERGKEAGYWLFRVLSL